MLQCGMKYCERMMCPNEATRHIDGDVWLCDPCHCIAVAAAEWEEYRYGDEQDV